MTDAAPSDVVNLPLSPEQAGAQRQQLMADPDYGKLAAQGDMAKVAELTRLWRIEHNMTPEPTPPGTVVDVLSQMSLKDIEIETKRLDAWAQHIHMTPERRFQMQRGLATKEQIEECKGWIDRAKRDPAFGRKVLSGDMEAKDRWACWHYVAYRCREAPDDYDWTAA